MAGNTEELAIIVSARDQASAAMKAVGASSQLMASQMAAAMAAITASIAAVTAAMGSMIPASAALGLSLQQQAYVARALAHDIPLIGAAAAKTTAVMGTTAATATKATSAFSGLWATAKKFAPILGAVMAFRALTKAMKAAGAAAIDFNRALHNVWTLTDQTLQEMEVLGEAVKRMAWNFPVAATTATKALYQIYSAVFYGSDAFEILEQSMKGAIAGLSDTFTVADMLTTVLNAYSMSANQAAHVNDLLFTAIKYGKTTLSELAGQFGRLAGVAAPVGASIEEMTAAIATLTRQGIMTDWAITSLRQTLMMFLRPPAELTAIIKELGFATGSALIRAEGFVGALKAVADQAEANNIGLDQLFTNVRAITAVLPLAEDEFREYTKDLERTATASGAASVAFKKQMSAWWAQLKKVGEQLKQVGISLMDIFIPGIVAAAQAVSFLAEGFKLLFDTINTVIHGLGGAADWIGSTLTTAFSKIVGLFTHTKSDAEKTADAFADMSADALDLAFSLRLVATELSDIGDKMDAINAGKGFIEGLSDLSFGFAGGQPGISFGFSAGGLDYLGRQIGDAIENAWQDVKNAVGDPAALNEALDIFYHTLREGTPNIEAFVDRIIAFGQEAGLDAKILEGLYDRLEETHDQYERNVAIFKVFGLSTEEAEAAALYLANALGQTLDAVESFNNAIDNITMTLGTAASQIAAAFAVLEAAFQGATTLGELAATAAGLIAGTGNLKALEENLQRIITGTGYAAETVEAARRALAQLTTGPTPGKTFAEIQEDIDRQAVQTAKDQLSAMKKAASAAQKAAREAAQAMQDAISNLKKTFSDMFDIPALEGLSTGQWKEAAAAIVGLVQHRKDIEAFAESMSKVTGETISAIDVMEMIKQAGDTLLNTLQSEIDLARLAGESVTDLERFQMAVKDIIDPLRRFKKEVINAIMGTPAQAGRDARTLLLGLLSGVEAGTLKIPSHRLGGFVEDAGFVYVHPGETIVPAATSNLAISDLSISGITGSGINMPSFADVPDTTFTQPPSFSSEVGPVSSSFADVTGALNSALSSLASIAGSAASSVSRLAGSIGDLDYAAVEEISTDELALALPRPLDMSKVTPPTTPGDEALAQIAKIGEDIAGASAQIAESNRQAAESRATAAKAQKLTEQIPADLEGLIKRFAPEGVDLAAAGNDIASSFEALDNEVKIYQDTISMMETYISDLDFLGLSDASRILKDRLYEFRAAIQGTTVAVLRWREALSGIVDVIHDSFVDFFTGFFGSLLGTAEEIKKSFASANLPRGFKLARAAWGVATPGQPWGEEEAAGGGGFSLADWFAELLAGIVNAVATGVGEWTWDFIVENIDWENLGALAWEAILAWLTAIYNNVYAFILGLFGEGSALGGIVASLVAGFATLFAGLTAVGVAIGIVLGVFAFLWGAIQGIGDLLTAFFAPIIEAVGWAWEALLPLIDGARNLFGSLSPIMEIFGEIIAWGIYLVTPLFSILGVALDLAGGVIRAVANGIKWVWDHTLAPVMNIMGWAMTTVANGFIWFGNALSDIIKFITFGLVDLGHVTYINPPGSSGDLSDPDAISPFIPQLQTAPGQWWEVARTGTAVVHEGERVGRGGGDTYVYNVTLPGVTNAQQFDDELEKLIRRKNLRNTGNRVGSYALSGA